MLANNKQDVPPNQVVDEKNFTCQSFLSIATAQFPLRPKYRPFEDGQGSGLMLHFRLLVNGIEFGIHGPGFA